MRPSRRRNKPESRVPRNSVPSGVSAIDNTIELGLGSSLIRSKRSPRHAMSPLTCAYTSSSPLLPTVMAVTATSRGSVAKGTLSKPESRRRNSAGRSGRSQRLPLASTTMPRMSGPPAETASWPGSNRNSVPSKRTRPRSVPNHR